MGISIHFPYSNETSGQFHKRFTSHVGIIRFSIINNSVIEGPSSILSLICDHDILHVRDKELVAAISAGCIFKFSRGLFHERFTSHASKLKFSIINNSVTVDPSSILGLICDHDV